MWACGSDSRQADSTRPSANENAISGELISSAPRANRAARSAVATSAARSSCSRISGGRVAALGLAVGQPRVRVDHGAVEDGLAVGRHLDRHAEAVLVRPQRAGVVGELVREHRRDETRDVRRERALGGAVVERRAGADEPRDVGDVHPGPDPVGLPAERERVVEVLRRLRVDRDRRQLAQVDAALERLGAAARTARSRPRAPCSTRSASSTFSMRRALPRLALDLRAAAARSRRARGRPAEIARALRVEHDRHPGREVGLARRRACRDGRRRPRRRRRPAPRAGSAPTRRKRRTVRPEPSAPSPRPIPSRIRAV